MITHITKNNSARYVALFAKATNALIASNSQNYPAETFSISSLEEYFQNLEELFLLDPKFLRLPVDEEMFEIDLNSRQITVPPTFKKSGLAVQGDDLAEIVYFKTDRFFDSTDLNETFVLIQWEAPSGVRMASPAYFQEVDSETDKLIFGWAVTKEMTSAPGTLKFSVSFVDGENKSEDGKEVNLQNLTYRLSTLASTININAGLSLASQKIIKFEDRLTDLKNRIKNTPILGGVVEGEASDAALVDYLGYSWAEDKVYKNIFDELFDIPNNETAETALVLRAYSPNAGLISYKWYKEDVNGPAQLLAEGPGAYKFLPVKGLEEQKSNNIPYFIIEGEDNFRYAEEKDPWFIIVDGKEVINPLLYERVAFLNVEGPGRYYAEITNKEGMKLKTITTPVAIIPGPTAIEAVEAISSADIFSEETPVTLSAQVELAETDLPCANFSYQWYLDENIIEGATNETHIAAIAGDYTVEVVNHWNKAVSEAVKSLNPIQLYPAAIKPEIILFEAREEDYLFEENPNYVLVGAHLTVDYKQINQDKATQTIYWQYSDNDGNDANEDWDYIQVDGEYVTGNTLVVNKPGDYRAVIENKITDNNKELSYSEKLSAYDKGIETEE